MTRRRRHRARPPRGKRSAPRRAIATRFACVALTLAAMAASPVATTASPGASSAQQAHLVVIVGAAGGEVYREVFHNWATGLVDAAQERLGLAPSQVTYLGEDPQLAPELIAAKSSRENIEATLQRLATEASTDDSIFIVLIGHGSGEGEQSRFNLPGRDLSAVEYDALLDLFVTQNVGFINTASASGDFAAVMAAPNRVIVTATRDGRQNNQTVFPRFFVEAFAGDVADLDKDTRVSLLEAYTYASREVKRFYEDDGRMLTETSQLEDDGDGEPSHEPEGGESDGTLARLMFLDNPLGAAAAGEAGGTEDPELRALYEEQRRLRVRIEELRRLKATMDPEVYDAELEKLLVSLARTDQAIRAKGGGG